MINIWTRIQTEINIWRIGALPGILVIALVVIARLTGSLQVLELIALDRLLRLRPSEPIDERIVIIGIDEEDIQRMKTYPVSDREIATLVRTLEKYRPTAIGLDIYRDFAVEPGHAELEKVFATFKNLIVIEKAIPDRRGFGVVKAPANLPSEQVGFSDLVPDLDGHVRRSLLSASNQKKEYRFSLALQLARIYLKKKGSSLENQANGSEGMRFGTTDLIRFRPNSGGYVGADAGGNQILLNFRSGKQPFRTKSLFQIQSGNINPDWIRGRIVLIGVTAMSIKDLVNSGATGVNPGLLNGVEFQAHAASQIISSVLDKRPQLQVWSKVGEYLWIVGWGFLGISLGRFLISPVKILLALVGASVSLVGISYGLLLWGWWVPIVPALLVLVLNGAGLTAALFYHHEQDLLTRIHERQLVIEQTFNMIHNGPLQTLATILRAAQEENLNPAQIRQSLQHLNQELRAVNESIERETLLQANQLHLGNDLNVNLQAPLHEILYEVYNYTLTRDLPYFTTLLTKIVKFEMMDDFRLSPEQKRGLCRFLEEALCNVGKHAIGTTKLWIFCGQEQGQQVIRVKDNGIGNGIGNSFGFGTAQAKNLSKSLRGKFQRDCNHPQGTICELTWHPAKFWFWYF